MELKLVVPLAFAVLLAILPSTSAAVVASDWRAQAMPRSARIAQQLADSVVAANPDMLDVLMHVTPPGGHANIVIAAHLRHSVGEASGDDDIGVMMSGRPLVEVQKDGVRIGVLVPLRDRAGRAIGALGLMYRYRSGVDQAATLQRSYRLRDALARRILSLGSLFA